MMLDHLGWHEAAELIVKGLSKSIANHTVTYDFARLIDGVEPISCSQFGREIIQNME